jgi:hypothetical protein
MSLGLVWFDLILFDLISLDPHTVRVCTRDGTSSTTSRLVLLLVLVLVGNLSRHRVLLLVLGTRRLPSTIRTIMRSQN